MMVSTEFGDGLYLLFFLFLGRSATSQRTNNQTESGGSYAAETPGRIMKCICDPPCGDNKTCSVEGMCYVAGAQLDSVLTRGCLSNLEQSNLVCKSNLGNSGNIRPGKDWIVCCDDKDWCNVDLEHKLPPVAAVQQTDGGVEGFSLPVVVAVAIPLALVFVLVVVMTTYLLCRRRHANTLAAGDPRLLEEDSLRGFQDSSRDQWSTGSGSGAPVLVKRTVGKEVTLEESIGKGRFGQVWRGTWRGQDVAVKIFTSREEGSWIKESDMYNTCMLRHENILGYHASDTVGRFSTTQNWLMFDYHRNGSLYDYLQRSDLDLEEMLVLAHSAAAGLSHLHNEIKQGDKRHEKPAIAHRDVKTKNMLVKANGECCIGDLGHAVRSDEMEPDISPEKLLVGTKRYMAPEVLTGSLNPAFFESFKCVDVYAFGLVLWEIARRARPFAEEYRVPLWDVVPADPSFEEMRSVVAVQQVRPPIPNKWNHEPVMYDVGQLMSECWKHNPKVRLTILRVKKNLQRMLQQVSKEHAERVEKLTPKMRMENSSSGNSSSGSSGHSSSIAFR